MAPAYVTVHALDAGHLTLRERMFMTPLDDANSKKTVPSLSFLIVHHDAASETTVRIVFDLGIRRRLEDYPEPIYKRTQACLPTSGDPDTVASLKRGNLTPADIDLVFFSHLHWDHIGTPSDYPKSTYVIGPDSLHLMDPKTPAQTLLEKNTLDLDRTIELPIPGSETARPRGSINTIQLQERAKQWLPLFDKPWQRKEVFPHTLDIFGDGSVRVVSAPGHIDGHINLLCRLESGKHVYLAGDAYHDVRLYTGEKEIATWEDEANPGVLCCMHKNKEEAARTIQMIREATLKPGELNDVEVVIAHDPEWAEKARIQGRFFPGSL